MYEYRPCTEIRRRSDLVAAVVTSHVSPSASHGRHQTTRILEVFEGKVAGAHGLRALEADDAHTHVGHLRRPSVRPSPAAEQRAH
jgi:hypothetical protein